MGIGPNVCRLFVEFRVGEADPAGLLSRLDQHLTVGPRERADDPAAWPRVEGYVAGVVARFAADPRVLGWDIYNEPGNSGRMERSLPLLKAAFVWARQATPIQPLTSAVWAWDDTFRGINEFLLSESDVISYHDYSLMGRGREIMDGLREYGRPLLYTEWMARTMGSRFETHLPVFREEDVGCFFWGLVNGRTQTHLPWGSAEGAPPPQVWFHDLLDCRGEPFDSEEVARIRREQSR